jgi:antirestriction protein ArdC
MKKSKKDIYQTVTDQIITALELDTGDPQMPWQRSGFQTGLPTNASTQNEYQGINILSLWASAMTQQFEQGLWATYRQWQAIDCQVKRGSKASMVVFYKEYKVDPSAVNEAEGDDGKRRVAKASQVFNVAQVEGYNQEKIINSQPPMDRILKADQFIQSSSASIQFGGDRAYYQPATDHIQMPDEHLFIGTETFNRQEAYYAVLLHELTHWTGHTSRLNRSFSDRFGNEAYAIEELVAELGSAFLCADLNITPETRPDHAKYIQSWLKVMKADNRAVFAAASKAQEAVRFLKQLK